LRKSWPESARNPTPSRPIGKKEKDLIARSRELKEKIEKLKLEEQTEERKGNLQRVAEIRYGLLRQAEEELSKLTAKIDGKGTGAPRS